MTTTKAYDYLDRLTSISSSSSSSFSSSFNYAYNSANQRTSVTNADKSRWAYGYDSLGQVTSGKKYWKDGTLVAGQQFEYTFDDIGNRTQTKSGGDASGANLRSASYSANSLNQYTSRGVPGYVDIFGVSFATNTVTVNGDSTYRKWEYFRNERQVDNSSNIWTNIVVAATGQTSVTGNVLVVQSPESFTYDADGNLTSDGAWTNTWNAENRLIATECRTNVPTAARMKEEWTYLPDGRWSQRIVSTNNGTSWVTVFTNRYLWDGEVLLAMLDHTNGLVMSFMRGLDLSGTIQGAGGVGGVLAVNFKTNGVHFAAYDGNGNVAALANAANGATSAQYEYGPFGETVRVTGPVAKQNPIRFSTQYADDVTGDLKYLYRDYNASTGRWNSRDPLSETGGKNLYWFVRNVPLTFVDIDGRIDWSGIIVIPPLYPPIIAYKCFQCGGKWFNPTTKCCCGDKAIERGQEKTSVKICTAPSHSYNEVPHEWLETGESSIDVVASDSIFGSPGRISVPSIYAGNEKKCTPVEVDRCEYDPEAFVSAVNNLLARYAALIDPKKGSYDDPSWQYSVIGHHCADFVREIVDKAKESSRRKDCKWFGDAF